MRRLFTIRPLLDEGKPLRSTKRTEFEESRPVPMMWFSPDGENWAVVDAEQTFGTDHPPTEVVVGESVLGEWSGLELTGYEENDTGELEDPPDLIWVAKLVGAP